MSINLEALESAFAEVEKLGKGETTFDVGGTPVTLRVLLPQEETSVQEWSGEGLDPEADEVGAASGVLHYLDRFKVDTLAYAIAQIGDLNLRDVKFLPNGETLDNDKPVKVPKHEAVRNLVMRWSTPIRDGVFRKYGELLEEVGTEAEDAIKFKPSDIDAEIERLKERIEELEAQKEAEKNRTGFAEQVAQINEADEVEAPPSEEPPAEEPPAPEPPKRQEAPTAAPQPAPAPQQPRRSVVPQQAAPPQHQAPPQRQQAAPQPYQHPDESIIGSDDMAAAVEAENRRLLEQRLSGQVAPPEPSGSALDAVRHAQRGGRVPPHVAAQQTQDAIQRAPIRPGHRGPEGIEAFSLDDPAPETVGKEPQRRQVSAADQINPTPKGRRNPRFRPPKT